MARKSARIAYLLALCLMALVAFTAPRAVLAQLDVIRGKVTNADGLPLGNVRVTATSIPGNVTRETRTNDKGAYQVAFPGGQGDYIMGFALVGFTFRQFEIKRTADQDVLVADARLAPIQLDTVTVAAPVQQRVNRNSTTPDVSGTERRVDASDVPLDAQGNLAAIAASLPGVLLVPSPDGGADGFSVLGLGADQNTTTLNGSSFGGGSLPRDAAISTSLVTSPYDVSRGGFSGGQLNIRSSGGSNYRNRGISFNANAPQLQWTDRASAAVGNEFTNLSLGGVATGPLKPNKAFYNLSFQLDRRSVDNQSLLSTSPLGFQTAGVAPDSVSRFLGVLRAQGVPSVGSLHSSRVNENATMFGGLDLAPPNSVSGSSYKITFNGGYQHQSPVGGGVTQLPNASGDRTSYNGSLQLGHNRYFGLILSETSADANLSRSAGEPYLLLPAGRVLVNSTLPNDASGVQSLAFGGNQGLSSVTRSYGSSFKNDLSWFDDANKHRIKLSTEIRYGGSTVEQASNLLGTFAFNSLADLEAGRASTFSRQLSAHERTSGQVTAGVSIGDSYRRNQDLQFQYGLRVETARFTNTPTRNPEVERAMGLRNDRVPTPITFSPRFGFSRTLGTAQEIGAFNGASRGPRAVLRGGVGVFTNSLNAGLIGGALDNTGLPSGVQQIYCVGDAAPIPIWGTYASQPAMIPDRCADGSNGTVFASSTPNVTLVSSHFRPQQTVRSNLSWTGSLLDARFSATVDGTVGLNFHQQRTVDLNFRPTTAFALASEGGRPVFVQPTAIVPTTGAIAWQTARVTPLFSRVSEIRSDLQSRTAQLQVRISPINRSPRTLGWNLAYTYMYTREQVNGFNSTDGNPLTTPWSVQSTGPHQISYGIRYNLFNYAQINWSGQFRSGSAYTPTIAGDVNGDGYSNDRAFVFDPSLTLGTDPALGAAMQQLLATTSGAARECLEKQMGRIASRNSCRGPWSSTASLNVSLDRVKFRMPQRASLNFSLSNPLGAADLALHGSGKLRGWGQNASPDQSLLYVRGFDAATNRYKYEVNQRFGGTRPQLLTLRAPVVLTIQTRIDLGPTRERQNLNQNLDQGRRGFGSKFNEGTFRSIGASSLVNPMSTILRNQDSLRLSSMQADSIAAMNRRYAYRVDSLWTPVARYLTALPNEYDIGEAYDRWLQARHTQLDLLGETARAVRELLTPAQRRKLPVSVTNFLDPLYLRSIRNGSGL